MIISGICIPVFGRSLSVIALMGVQIQLFLSVGSCREAGRVPACRGLLRSAARAHPKPCALPPPRRMRPCLRADMFHR